MTEPTSAPRPDRAAERHQGDSPRSPGLEKLDDAFLRYIGVEGTAQRLIQATYLPYFAQRQRVVDLGCGDGDFVALLQEAGHAALGVDMDAGVVARGQAAGLPVLEMDVFAWLDAEAAAVRAGRKPAWDGVFSAHLVEHLPYPQVLALCAHIYQILAPGGICILATPNVAALSAHLDGYYKHFGHVTFYHPELLAFFLDHVGFQVVEKGVNPQVPSTLFFPVLRQLNAHQVELDRIEAVSREILPEHSQITAESQALHSRFRPIFAQFSALHQGLQQQHGALGAGRAQGERSLSRPWERLKAGLMRWLLGSQLQQLAYLLDQAQATIDQVAQQNRQAAQMAELWQQNQLLLDRLNGLLAKQGTLVRDVARTNRQMEAATRTLLEQVDGPFEAYVVAAKASGAEGGAI